MAGGGWQGAPLVPRNSNVFEDAAAMAGPTAVRLVPGETVIEDEVVPGWMNPPPIPPWLRDQVSAALLEVEEDAPRARDRFVHNVIAHPLMWFCPPVGRWLHDRTEP